MPDDIEGLRKRIAALEQELANKIEYYENILSLLPGHVYWLDRQNVYLGCNEEQARHAGLQSRFDIVNKTNAELPWREQAVELDLSNLAVMETGIPQTSTEFARISEGDRVYFSQKVPLRNKANQTIGLLGISLDITELKKTQEKLAQAKENAEAANRAKDEFIRNMSHDIRTPLSGIIGMSSILEQEAQSQAVKEYAHMVNVSG
jgi:two-component system, OmpR family, aerobic respiration control sensor histidine kinase ArcB